MDRSHQQERLRALHEIHLAITSTLDLRTVLDRLLEKIDHVLPYPAASVSLWNKNSGQLEPVACRNLDEQEWKHGAGSLSQRVFENRAPLRARNAPTDPRIGASGFFRKQGLVSCLGVPLIAKGEILGVFSFYTKEEHEFADEEVEFLSTLAGQAASAIQNAQLYERSKKQALELEKANKVKTEFLSVMSHELRTPLSMVMGYTSMVQDKVLGEINPEQEKAVGKVLRHCNDLLTMIRSIFEATRIEAGAVSVELGEINLKLFLDGLRSSYEIPLDKEPTLTWDYPRDLPVVKTDSGKLRQILQNLINNALKLTERGHVTISARCHPATRTMEFRVADTGIGVPPEALPVIFEMFHEIDNPDMRVYGGIGLGLHIVKSFTEMLGGMVSVESRPDKGSTFTVKIPYDG